MRIDANEGRDGQIGARMALAERPVHSRSRKTELRAKDGEVRPFASNGRDNVGPMPSFSIRVRAQSRPPTGRPHKNVRSKSILFEIRTKMVERQAQSAQICAWRLTPCLNALKS